MSQILGPKKNLIGLKSGKLEVLRLGERIPSRKQYKWVCLCDCGNIVSVRQDQLVSGNSKSCGCYQREVTLKRQITHNKSRSPEYEAHKNMLARCYSKSFRQKKDYEDRGITVCDEWRGPGGFEIFYKHMGDRPSKNHQLDRINNDLGYEPNNCRWTTRRVQQNNRRVNRKLTYKDETKTLSQWAERQGLRPGCLSWRLQQGWDIEKALTTPSGRDKTITP